MTPVTPDERRIEILHSEQAHAIQLHHIRDCVADAAIPDARVYQACRTLPHGHVAAAMGWQGGDGQPW